MRVGSFFALALPLFVATAAHATTNGGQRLVVYRDGSTRTFALNATAAAAAPGCDAATVFAIDVNASPIALTLERTGAPVTSTITATLSCSNLASGTASFGFVSNASSSDVSVGFSPGAISLNLASSSAQAPSSIATISAVDKISTQLETIAIKSAAGYYTGQDKNGSSLAGAIPAGSAALVSVTVQNSLGKPPPVAVADPAAAAVAPAVNDVCKNVDPKSPQYAQCNALATANAAATDPKASQQVKDAATSNYIQVTPSTAVAKTSTQAVSGQLGNLIGRIAVLQNGGGGGLSTAGLTFGGNSLPFSFDEYVNRLNATDGTSGNEDKRTLLGGTRWGYWISGNIGGGEATRYQGNSGFDFHDWALTGGGDYRINDRTFAGVAFGYSRLKSNLTDGQSGDLNANTWSLHGYGGYAPTADLNLDASVSWLHTRYRQNRSIELQQVTLDANGNVLDVKPLPAESANGKTNTNQLAASIGATWNLRRGDWTFAPQAQYQFIKADVDGFQETGSSLFLVRYGSQHIVTRSLSAGVYTDVTAATNIGTFRPYARVLFYADAGTGVRNLAASFVSGSQAIEGLVINEPDRSYGTAEVGLGFSRPIGSRTVDFNFSAMKLFWFTAFDRWSVRADMRVPF